jgi:hypothetical protein
VRDVSGGDGDTLDGAMFYAVMIQMLFYAMIYAII